MVENPTHGDVLLAPDSISGRGYTLSLAPDGPSQLWYASYEQALAVALHWASTSGVRVWRKNGSAGFDPVQHSKAGRSPES